MISPKITNPHVEIIIATAGLKHFSIKTGKDLIKFIYPNCKFKKITTLDSCNAINIIFCGSFIWYHTSNFL